MSLLMTSNIRILFTEKGKPIKGLPVRAGKGAKPRETDDDGQVEMTFPEGSQTIEIKRGGNWREQVVEVTRESSLIIVDLARHTTGHGRAPKADTNFLDIGKLNLGDRYVFDEVLGRGGMSVVLKARDRLLNRDVAIKLLSQELHAQPEAQNIFLTEARSLATLSHPNLVAVHDICKVDEQVFIVIEYVEGQSLESLIGTVGGFNETVALQTLIQLARVVAYLHARGIVHRDLKPANAMIRNDGTLKLIDFGLARYFEDLDIRGTRVRGTPAYMSPEQLQGDPLTPACDIYQLGVCLFEAVTGQLPFTKGDVGYSHVHKPPPRADGLNPKISKGLADLIDSCLRKEPARRPTNGQELLRQLQMLYQSSGATGGGNLLEQLRREMPASSEPESIEDDEIEEGYSTSEMRLMESAGRHLRTSDFKSRAISELLSDPNLRSQIVIRHGETRWFPIVGGAALGAAITSTLLFFVMMGHLPGQQPATDPEPPVTSSSPIAPTSTADEQAATRPTGTELNAPVFPAATETADPPPTAERRPDRHDTVADAAAMVPTPTPAPPADEQDEGAAPNDTSTKADIQTGGSSQRAAKMVDATTAPAVGTRRKENAADHEPADDQQVEQATTDPLENTTTAKRAADDGAPGEDAASDMKDVAEQKVQASEAAEEEEEEQTDRFGAPFIRSKNSSGGSGFIR